MQFHTSYIAIKLHFPHTRLAYDLIAWQELLFDHYSPFFSPLFTPIHLYSPLFTPYSLLFILSHPCLSLFIPYSPLFTFIHSCSPLFTSLHLFTVTPPLARSAVALTLTNTHCLLTLLTLQRDLLVLELNRWISLICFQFRVIFKAFDVFMLFVECLFLLCVFVWRLYIQTLSPWVLEIVACLSAWLRKALVACTSTTTHHHTTTDFAYNRSRWLTFSPLACITTAHTTTPQTLPLIAVIHARF